MTTKEKIYSLLLIIVFAIQCLVLFNAHSHIKSETKMDRRTNDTSAYTTEPGKIRPDEVSQTPETLALSFITVVIPLEPSLPKTTVVQKFPPNTAIQPINTYMKLGVITDSNGIKRVYIKHLETGQLLKARQDGIDENGICYKVDGTNKESIIIKGISYVLVKEIK